MFRTARLKMTASYVLIVMIVSITFSCGMYALLQNEVQRFAVIQRLGIEHMLEEQTMLTNVGYQNPSIRLPIQPQFKTQLANPDLERNTLHRIQLVLLYINLGVLI